MEVSKILQLLVFDYTLPQIRDGNEFIYSSISFLEIERISMYHEFSFH